MIISIVRTPTSLLRNGPNILTITLPRGKDKCLRQLTEKMLCLMCHHSKAKSIINKDVQSPHPSGIIHSSDSTRY